MFPHRHYGQVVIKKIGLRRRCAKFCGVTMNHYSIDPSGSLALNVLGEILRESKSIMLSDDAIHSIASCRHYLDHRMETDNTPIYGINTGFGALCNERISPDDLAGLQRNLLLSHACGMGEEVDEDIVRLMLLLKIQSLSLGRSGVRVETVQRLTDFYNMGILPVIYKQGSLGASGDLAPLAHMALPLIGEGKVRWNGAVVPAGEALQACGLEPLTLDSKEGLALINGTQFMAAHLAWILIRGEALADYGLVIAAMSCEAFNVRTAPFHDLTHAVRPHEGQRVAARRMCELLAQSEIASAEKEHVQDPYSFRCIPQVHGASLDVLRYARQVLQTEINSVTDNPIIFPDENQIISGGNFHGQPLALALDFLAIALAELASISERRTYKLLSGQRGLPPFLTPDPGLHSGFMICQYTSASIVSQNKQLCTPASVDTIDSSNGQEDHVSMGANAATKAVHVVNNLQSVLAVEAMTAAQALNFRRPLMSSTSIESLHKRIRELIPFATADIDMSTYLPKMRALLNE